MSPDSSNTTRVSRLLHSPMNQLAARTAKKTKIRMSVIMAAILLFKDALELLDTGGPFGNQNNPLVLQRDVTTFRCRRG